MSSKLAPSLAQKVRSRAANRCEYCCLPQFLQEAEFHIDHVFPRALGGSSLFDNLALACVTCSLKKGHRIVSKDPPSGKTSRLFNPRTDKWETCFHLKPSGEIKGRNAIGRCTVDLLAMNQSRILRIRQSLMRQNLW